MPIVKEQLGVEELVFVGHRGMVKSKGKQALKEAGLRYITALTDPQIRRLCGEGTLQMSLFSEAICEVEADGVRYLLRKNEDEEARQWHRLEDKLAKLAKKLEQRHGAATAGGPGEFLVAWNCTPAALPAGAQRLEKVPQNESRRPNWMLRGLPAEVILPKSAAVRLPCGPASCVVLKALKNSARNCSLARSPIC